MFFPTAGIEVPIWLPPLIACGISFFTSMGGISGAFLLLPFQMSVLGYTTPSVSATSQLFNVIAIPGGVGRYIREGRMLWPLTWTIVGGTLPGVLLGTVIRVAYLHHPKNFKIFTALVLLYIGGRLAADLLSSTSPHRPGHMAEQRFHETAKRRHASRRSGETPDRHILSRIRVLHVSFSSIEYEFQGDRFVARTRRILFLSFLVGIVSGIYGNGGGALIAPFLVSYCRLPVYTIAGATLTAAGISSAAGVLSFAALAPFFPSQTVAPDWALGILFGIGGILGMNLGARLQKYVPAMRIKWMLAVVILGTAGKYAYGFFFSG